MKNKKVTFSILLLGFGLTVLAQQATTAAGGDASGSGGTVVYSIGQIVYTASTSSYGSVAQGVQHPYEILVLGLDNQQISIKIQAYPNPTSDFLSLNIGIITISTLKFQLYDISGRLIKHKKITSTTETIRMENLPRATYFLKVTNNNQELKTFKIIKN